MTDQEGIEIAKKHSISFKDFSKNESLHLMLEKGNKLSTKNITTITVISKGKISGRDIVQIRIGNFKLLFYKCFRGNSEKQKGVWYPIPGFLNQELSFLPCGWFVKNNNIDQFYNQKSFKQISDILSKMFTE